MRSAAIRLPASARPLPAMSNAVPWSGLVRTKGRPSVTLTPCSTPRYLTGIRPWSWVIATTRSNSPGWPGAWRARMNTVSGANGPRASMPSARAAATAGAMMRDLLVAEQPAFAGMRVQPGHRDARRAPGPRRAARAVGDAQRLQHGVEVDRVDGAAQRQVDGHQHHAQLVVGQHHAHRRRRRRRGASACSISVWPGKGHAGGGQRLLVDRRGDDGRHLAGAAPARRRASMQRAAARAGSGRRRGPAAASARPAGRPGGCSTGRQPGGTAGSVGRRVDRATAAAAGSARRGAARPRRPAPRAPAGAPRAKARDDDLGADAAGVAHRQRQQGRVMAAVAQAGLSMSMKRCSGRSARPGAPPPPARRSARWRGGRRPGRPRRSRAPGGPAARTSRR